MNTQGLIDKTGIIIGVAFFIFSAFLFYNETGMLADSIAAALIAAVSIWGMYVVLKMCILTYRR